MPVSRSQTVSYLKRRFREVGLEPDSRHGQNFLVDMNLQRVILDAAQLDAQDVVLEVGTGTGGLTALMAERVAAVVTVEIDRHLHQMASEELIDCGNVTILLQDVLRNKNNFDSRVLDTIAEKLAEGQNRRFKLVANLPYNIATPVIANLLLTPIVPETMTVTIQKELADRVTARPSTKDYGHLSVWMQSQCQVQVVRLMPPTVFWPRPKVDSAILHIVVVPELRRRIPDLPFFHRFVRALFLHRRKYLRSVLCSAFKKQLQKADVDAVLEESGFSAQLRAEQLPVEEIIRLCEAFRTRLS